MVFDPEPKRADVAVNVRIPGENETKFAPKVEAKAPEKKLVEEPKPEAKQPEEGKVDSKKAAAGEFAVQVGAFANPEGAIAKLAAAGGAALHRSGEGQPDARARGPVREP